jgi:hypothetical protein
MRRPSLHNTRVRDREELMASWVEKKRTKRSAGRKPALRRVLAALFAAMLAGGIYVVAAALAGQTVPAPTITSGPANPTNQTSATFEFTDSASVTFQCSLDGAPWAACTSPTTYAGPLKAGGHNFKVKAKNSQNQFSAEASYGWTIDLSPPPAPQITASPANPSNQSAPSFSFKDGDTSATFLCKLDDAPSFTACTSPQGYTGMGEGGHTFRVEAKDAAGNIGPATSYAWTIDLTLPPPPSIASAPANPISSHDASFSFSDTEAGVSFMCKLDADSYKPCSSPKKYTGVPDGSHTFAVVAVDAAGNSSSPALYTWTVDTQPPPKPTITSSPPDPSFSTTATFEFTDSEAGVSFLCKIDGGTWLACSSPKTYSGLPLGDREFHVRALDPAGNQGAEVAYKWKIKAALGLPFHMTGTPDGLLYPGAAARTIPLTLTNPNSVPIYVASLNVTAVVSGLPPGCDGSAFVVTQANFSANPAVQVPANGSVTLPAQGVTAPKIQMNDNHQNQDACKSANFALNYTGSAHS